MAHLLTDEAFALTIAHFRRLGRTDERGYWIAGVGVTFIPWNLATLAGVVVGAQIPDPNRFGIDIIFPAAMAGLAVGLITGRRELVAAIVGGGDRRRGRARSQPGHRDRGRRHPGTGWSVCWSPPRRARDRARSAVARSAERYAMPGAHFDRATPDPPTERRADR